MFVHLRYLLKKQTFTFSFTFMRHYSFRQHFSCICAFLLIEFQSILEFLIYAKTFSQMRGKISCLPKSSLTQRVLNNNRFFCQYKTSHTFLFTIEHLVWNIFVASNTSERHNFIVALSN